MINALSSIISGISNASRQVAQSAEKIAVAGTEAGKDVDITEEAVKIKISEAAYKANVAMLKVQDDMMDELLSTFDERV